MCWYRYVFFIAFLKNISNWTFLLTFIFVLPIPYSHAATELLMITEETPPHSYFDAKTGKAAGFAVEVVEELIKRSDVKPVGGNILIYPWARGYKLLESRANVMLFLTTRSAAREDLFQWVGPISPRVKWLWKLRKNKHIEALTLEDAKKYSVGGVREFASTKLLEKIGFKVDYSNKEKYVYEKLFRGRVDLINGTETFTAYYLRLFGYPFAHIEKVVQLESKHDYYLAFNKGVPKETINKMQKELGRMFMDGTYTQIREQYLK